MSTKVPQGYRVELTAIYLAGHEEWRIGRVQYPIGTLPRPLHKTNVTFIKGSQQNDLNKNSFQRRFAKKYSKNLSVLCAECKFDIFTILSPVNLTLSDNRFL